MNIDEIYKHIKTNYPNLKILIGSERLYIFDTDGYRCICRIIDDCDVCFNKYKQDGLVWSVQKNYKIPFSACTLSTIDDGIKDYIYSWEKMLEFIKRCKIKNRLADMENDFIPQ